MVTTLWFSYSFPDYLTLDSPEPNRSPYHHTWHVGRMLRQQAQGKGWGFEYRNLFDERPVEIGLEDIVIGHAWFTGNSFMEQASQQPCRARFIMQPYTEKMVGDEALESLHFQWSAADWLFLNTGSYWFDRMPESDYARYADKATRVDNVVNPALHPHSKRQWHEAGKRVGLCIGYNNPVKGVDLVADLARTAGFKLVTLGLSDTTLFQHVPQLVMMDGMNFTPENITWLCQEVDFFLTMGRFDANPTTLLETSCWGLLACCTEQCGYYANQPFIELRLDDMVHNWDVIDWIQHAPQAELSDRANVIRQQVIAGHSIQTRLDTMWNKICEVLGEPLP